MGDSDLDIKEWHNPADANVDICFIHGLGGHRENTWTAKSKKAEGPWPPNLLPKELPQARLLTYGYDSRVITLGTSSENTIRIFSNSLLNSLTRVRAASNSLRRPIIFVVHSLGGLVCKRAIALSKQRSHAQDHNLLAESLVGIVFMGTPHRGSNIANAAGVLLTMMSPIKSSNRGLLKSLAKDNQTAEDIEDDFWDAVDSTSTDSQKSIQIYCFHETKPRFPLRSCVVPKNSATYFHRPSDMIEADHSKMVKFESSEVASFKNLCHVLHTFLRSDRLRMIILSDPPAAVVIPSTDASPSADALSENTEHQEQAMPLPLRPKSPPLTQHILLPFNRNLDFVARKDVLQQLHELLFDQGCMAVALFGLGGGGKTQVANALAHAVKDNKDLGYSVFWVPALSMTSFQAAYQSIAKKVGLQIEADQDARVLVREYLSSDAAGSWLLILDNADDFDLVCGKDGADCLETFLPRSDCGRVLITTRFRTVAETMADQSVPLKDMNLAESRAMANKLLQNKAVVGTAEAKRSLDELLKELVYLPLAIKQAISFLNQTGLSPKAYLGILQKTEADRLDLLSGEAPDRTRYRESRHAIATTWLVTFDRLQKHNPEAIRLLGFLSQVLPKAIPTNMLPSKGSDVDLLNTVKVLSAYSFVSIHNDSMLDMHSLVHMAARSWFQRNKNIDDTVTKTAQHLSQFTSSMPKNDEHFSRPYLPHFFSFLDININAPSLDILHFFLAAARVLTHTARYTDFLSYAEICAQWAYGHLPESHKARLDADYNLAIGLLHMHSDSSALKAMLLLENVVRVRESAYEVDVHLLKFQRSLVHVYMDTARFCEAEKLAGRIRGQWNVLHDHVSFEAEIKTVEAVILREDGKLPESIAMLEDISRSQTSQDDSDDIGDVRLCSDRELAITYTRAGRINDAISVFENIVHRLSSLPDDSQTRLWEVYLLGCLYLRNGNYVSAIEMLEDCTNKQRTRRTFDMVDYLNAEYYLSKSYFANGETKKAIPLMEQVINLANCHPDDVKDRAIFEADLQHMKSKLEEETGQA